MVPNFVYFISYAKKKIECISIKRTYDYETIDGNNIILCYLIFH